MSTLNVRQLNAHNRQGAVRFMLGTNGGVLGYNEVQKVQPFLRGRKHYRLHVGQKVKASRNTAQGVATLVRKKYDYLGQWHQQVSQYVKAAPKVAPDRFFLGSIFEFEGEPVFHLNFHPNATVRRQIERGREDGAIVREYKESMEWFEAVLEFYRKMGVRRVVGGDANCPKGLDFSWTPYAIMKRQGMLYRSSGIDVIGWDKKTFDLADFRVIPKARVGSDHPGLCANLRMRNQ